MFSRLKEIKRTFIVQIKKNAVFGYCLTWLKPCKFPSSARDTSRNWLVNSDCRLGSWWNYDSWFLESFVVLMILICLQRLPVRQRLIFRSDVRVLNNLWWFFSKVKKKNNDKKIVNLNICFWLQIEERAFEYVTFEDCWEFLVELK